MTGFNAQMCMKEGVYRIQFETTNRLFFDLVQDAARSCVDAEDYLNKEINKVTSYINI